MLILIALAHATPPPATVRAAMQLDTNWEDIGTKDTDIGPVRMRHLVMDGVDCLEGSATTRQPADELLAIAVEVGRNQDWTSADMVLSEALSKDGNRVHYLQVLNNPPPISDRYWYLEGKVVPEGGGQAFRWDHLDGATAYGIRHTRLMQAYDGAVEVTFNLGSWAFLPRPDGQTLARFRSCSDAGGRIPKWAGEAAAKAMLPNNLEDLITHAERH
jgi:hypothetical protein